MVKRSVSFMLVLSVFLSMLNAITVFAYSQGGYQANFDYEADGNYTDETYGIGNAIENSDTYVAMRDVEGIVTWKGTSTYDGNVYNYENEGPNATYILEYDIRFEGFISDYIDTTIRVYDESIFPTTGTFAMALNYEKIEDGTGHSFVNDRWYRIRHELYVTSSNNTMTNSEGTYSMWVDGKKIIERQRYGAYPNTTWSYHKLPQIDFCEFRIGSDAKAAGATYIIDNFTAYKSNPTAEMTVNKGSLISAIREAEKKTEKFEFGTKPNEYPLKYQEELNEVLTEAKQEYESTASTDSSVENAIEDLNEFINSMQINGNEIIIKQPKFFDGEEEEREIYNLSEANYVKIEVPVTFSENVENIEKDITVLGAIYDTETGMMCGEPVFVSDKYIPRESGMIKTYNITPEQQLDLSSYSDAEKEKLELRIIAFDNFERMTLYTNPICIIGNEYETENIIVDESINETVNNVTVSKEYLNEDTSKITISFKTEPDKNVALMLTKYNADMNSIGSDDIQYIKQIKSNNSGLAEFEIYVDDAVGNGVFNYILYSGTSGKTISDEIQYISKIGIDRIFELIYLSDNATAWENILNNESILGISTKWLSVYKEHYSESDIIPQSAVAKIKQKQYTYSTLSDFYDDLLKILKEESINYLNNDGYYDILLDEASDTNITDLINIGSDETKYGIIDSTKYKVYKEMSNDERIQLYSMIREYKDNYTIKEFGEAFKNFIYTIKPNEFPSGGVQFFDDYENTGNFKDSSFKIGNASTVTSQAGVTVVYPSDELMEGITVYKGDATLTGTAYDYAKEGPNASLVIEYDVMFKDLVETQSSAALWLYDKKEYQQTFAVTLNFDGAAQKVVLNNQTLNYKIEDNKWYNVRCIVQATNNKTEQVNLTHLYINGEKIGENIGFASVNYYKFPVLNYIWLRQNTNSTAVSSTSYYDNIKVYKSNINSAIPINKGRLLSAIRTMQAIKKSAVFGEGENEYSPELETILNENIDKFIKNYDNVSTEEEITEEVAEIVNVLDSLQPNGKKVVVGEYKLYNDDTNQSINSIIGVSNVRVEIPVSISRYGNETGEKILPIFAFIKKDENNKEVVTKLVQGNPCVYYHEREERKDYLIEEVINISDVPAGSMIKVILIEDGKSPVPYITNGLDLGTSAQFKYNAEIIYGETLDNLCLSVDGTPNDDILVTVYEEESLLYANQCSVDETGKVKFYVNLEGVNNGETLKYYIYSLAENKVFDDDLIYYESDTVNTLLSDVFNGDTTTAKTLIAENYNMLGLNGGILELYNKNSIVPIEAVTAVKQILYTVENINEFKKVFREEANKSALNYLQTDECLAEILNEKSDASVTEIIGVGSDESKYGNNTAKRYETYIQMDESQKKHVYNYLRKKNNYSLEAQKEAFEDGVVIARINSAVNADTIITTISSNADIISNAASFNNISSGIIQRSAASLIMNHSDFLTVAELEAYIPEAIKKATSNTANGQGNGGSAGGGSGTRGTSIATAPTVDNEKVNNTINNTGLPFTDISETAWAQEAIEFLYTKNVIHGKSDTKFAPNDCVTREEFIKMAVILFDIPLSKGNCKFTDVEQGSWYEPYVVAAYNNSVINGITDSLFGSGEQITREQLVTVAYNAALKYGIDNNEELFYVPFVDDANISEYAKKPVELFASLGIINGRGDNLFMPKESSTRAEAAKILFNVYMLQYK